MPSQMIPVIAFEIDVDALVDDLKHHGVVVLVTNRTHARSIASEVATKLGTADRDDDDPYLTHLSFEVDDRGWDDCLMYSGAAEYQPEDLRRFTIAAIRSWLAAGSKPYHVFAASVSQGVCQHHANRATSSR